jgi:predicted dehydrogenase
MLQNRMNGAVLEMKRRIQTDASLGKLAAARAFLTWNRTPEYYASEPWRGKWATEGGGLLINQAIHVVDLLSGLAGGIAAVRASISTKALEACIEVEDTADALLTFENGARGAFYATNAYPADSPFFVEFAFENAVLRYDAKTLFQIKGGETAVLARDGADAPGKAYWGGGHKRVISAFYRALAEGTDDFISLRDAANSARALFAFYESAKLNRKVEVEQ